MEPNIVAVLSCAWALPQNIADRTSTRNSFQLLNRMFVNILRPRELSVCLIVFISTPNDSSFNEQLSRIFIGSVTKSVTIREKAVSRPGWDRAKRYSHHPHTNPKPVPVDGHYSAEKLVTATHEQQTEIPQPRTEDDSPRLPSARDGPPQDPRPPTPCAAPGLERCQPRPPAEQA
jgi:hypothetical protein